MKAGELAPGVWMDVDLWKIAIDRAPEGTDEVLLEGCWWKVHQITRDVNGPVRNTPKGVRLDVQEYYIPLLTTCKSCGSVGGSLEAHRCSRCGSQSWTTSTMVVRFQETMEARNARNTPKVEPPKEEGSTVLGCLIPLVALGGMAAGGYYGFTFSVQAGNSPLASLFIGAFGAMVGLVLPAGMMGCIK